MLGLEHLVEHHEVVDQDVVHPPDRVERVEVVLAALGLDVRRLRRQPARCRVHLLAGRLQHASHRVLRQPPHPHVGVLGAQRLDDRQVAPGVAQADRRREHEHLALPAQRPRPAPRGLSRMPGARRHPLDEPVSSRLTTTGSRIAGRARRRRARPASPPGQLGEPHPVVERAHPVVAAVQHEDRALHGSRRAPTRWCTPRRAETPGGGVGQGLRGRARAPSLLVLELAGRVRLVEHLPRRRSRRSRRSRRRASSAGCTSPSPWLSSCGSVVEVRELGLAPSAATRRTPARSRPVPHPVGVLGGHLGGPRGTAREAHEHRPLHAAASMTATVSAAYSAFAYAAAPPGGRTRRYRARRR